MFCNCSNTVDPENYNNIISCCKCVPDTQEILLCVMTLFMVFILFAVAEYRFKPTCCKLCDADKEDKEAPLITSDNHHAYYVGEKL